MRRAPGAGDEIGGWRLLRPLGRGETGQVYLAASADGRRTAALKVIALPVTDAAALRQFERQTAALQRLRHPDIVQLWAAGLDGGHAWLAMEAVPGSDLGRYTAPSRLLPEPLVVAAGARIASALAHAHREGIVHRDLKPANVLVHLPSGTLKVADFGLARPQGAESTRTGLIVGTPAYMAPEQLAGMAPDAQTDLYALGVTLFELLSGRRPHEADSMGELLRRVAGAPPLDLAALRPDLPAALTRLVVTLLARDRAQRPRDAEAVAAVLAAIQADIDAAGASRTRPDGLRGTGRGRTGPDGS
jgi:serine/threonine-protein kinase